MFVDEKKEGAASVWDETWKREIQALGQVVGEIEQILPSKNARLAGLLADAEESAKQLENLRLQGQANGRALANIQETMVALHTTATSSAAGISEVLRSANAEKTRLERVIKHLAVSDATAGRVTQALVDAEGLANRANLLAPDVAVAKEQLDSWRRELDSHRKIARQEVSVSQAAAASVLAQTQSLQSALAGADAVLSRVTDLRAQLVPLQALESEVARHEKQSESLASRLATQNLETQAVAARLSTLTAELAQDTSHWQETLKGHESALHAARNKAAAEQTVWKAAAERLHERGAEIGSMLSEQRTFEATVARLVAEQMAAEMGVRDRQIDALRKRLNAATVGGAILLALAILALGLARF